MVGTSGVRFSSSSIPAMACGTLPSSRSATSRMPCTLPAMACAHSEVAIACKSASGPAALSTASSASLNGLLLGRPPGLPDWPGWKGRPGPRRLAVTSLFSARGGVDGRPTGADRSDRSDRFRRRPCNPLNQRVSRPAAIFLAIRLCWKTRWDAFCPQFHAIGIRHWQ
jgi:hypothetical protein